MRDFFFKKTCHEMCTVSGFTTSTLFDDSIAGLTLERFMSLSESICEPKEAWSNQCRYQTSKVHESNKIEDLLYDPFTLDIKTHWFIILSTWLFKVICSWSFQLGYWKWLVHNPLLLNIKSDWWTWSFFLVLQPSTIF